MHPGPDRFSSRTAWPSQSNRLSLLLEEKRRKKAKILDLTESNPTKCAFAFYGAGMLAPFADPGNLSYDPDPRGLEEARESVCRYYAEKDIKISPDQVLLTAGTSEAYGFLFQLLADPGDEALTAEPGYPLFDTLAQIHGVTLKKFSSVYREAWRIDAASLEREFSGRTKALLLVHPNNPTGHFISSDERGEAMALCRKSGAALVADEVFLDHAWGAAVPPKSFAGEKNILTFTLSGISKVLGLPQMKLSWIVVNGPELLRKEALRRLEILADAYLSVTTPAQRALAAWMKERSAAVNEINARAKANFQYLKENAPPIFSVLETEGGWHALLQGPPSMGDEDFALELLRKQDTRVHPGFLFDLAEGFLVLSLLPEAAVFSEGLRRLGEQSLVLK